MQTAVHMHLIDKARPFLSYLEHWYEHLPTPTLAEVIGDDPANVVLMSVDMINGFCKEGPLASERVGALAGPVVSIFQRAYDLGVRNLVLTQDTHDPNTEEFQAYPPHCVRGTAESEAIDELKALPFYNDITIIEKNALNSYVHTTLNEWLAQRPNLETFIIVGDCTDLCVYATAMHARIEANARTIHRRVIVPASTVDTFDITVNTAQAAGIKAHDGDLHHVLFLHHMALNGVEVVRDLG